MIKIGYATQMSYQVTDEEKLLANKALIRFKHVMNALKNASEYLNTLNTPFKDNLDMQPDQIMKVRSALRRFRDKSVKNFNKFKVSSFQCIKIMNKFSTDTQTVKLLKSFINSIGELEIEVNLFVDRFDDLKDKEFTKNVTTAINAIQKKCTKIEELIDERIIKHIQDNILAKTWVNNVGDSLNIKIDKEVPDILKWHKVMQDKLNNISKGKN